MKKKFISSVVAALMVLTMGTTVFAAPSVTTDTAYSGNGAEATITETTSEIKETATSKATEKLENVTSSEVVAVFDIHQGDLTKGEDGLYKVELVNVPNVKAGDKVVVYHEANGGEILAADVTGDGKVTFKTASFSKFAVVKYTVKASYNGWAGYPWGATTETAAATTATTAATSPKTADAAPVLPVLAVICLAGVVVCGKKVKFNN